MSPPARAPRREGQARTASRVPSRERAAEKRLADRTEKNLTDQVAEQLAEQIVAKLTDDRPLLDQEKAARRLGVSRWTVRRLVDAGELKPVKVGTSLRYRQADIEQYLNRLDAAS